VRAVALGDPARSQRQRSRSLREDEVYHQVFNPGWNLNVYLASLEITRAVELVLNVRRSLNDTPPMALVHFVAFAYACSKLGKSTYGPEEVGSLAGSPPGAEDVKRIRDELRAENNDPKRAVSSPRERKLTKRFIEQHVQERLGAAQRPKSDPDPSPAND
jgi:hypothetical protein